MKKFISELTKQVLAQFVARSMSDTFKREVAKFVVAEMDRKGVWVPRDLAEGARKGAQKPPTR